MTSPRFLIGVVVGAVGAWFFGARAGGGAPGVGGPRGKGAAHPHARYSGLGRFR